MNIKLEDYLFIVITPFLRQEYNNTFIADNRNMEGPRWRIIGIKNGGIQIKNNIDIKECKRIFIDQCCDNIKEVLQSIRDNTIAKILVWTHRTQQGAHQPFLDTDIRAIFNDRLISCEVFSHPDNSVKTIVSMDCNDSCLLEILTKYIKKKSVNDAHTLRSEILTPFIPFHLYHDPDNNKTDDWNTILGDCCAAINAKDKENNNSIKEKFNTLIGLKSDLSDETKNSARDAFEILKTNFQTGEGDCVEKVKETDCHKTIEAFAKYLEEIVNSIEESKGN